MSQPSLGEATENSRVVGMYLPTVRMPAKKQNPHYIVARYVRQTMYSGACSLAMALSIEERE